MFNKQIKIEYTAFMEISGCWESIKLFVETR